jgi:hypothetical protein
MSTSLRQRLDDLASTFANGVLHAIRSASIEDLLAESGGGRRVAARAIAAEAAPSRGARRRTGRLPRRSAEDIGQVIDRIVALVKQSPKGLRAEEIRQKLDLQAKEMPRPLKEAVEAGRLGKSGQKRATTYVAKGGGAARPAAKAARPARSARKGHKSAKSSRASKAAKQAK